MEYVTYGVSNFFSDVGGYMGLFLGWSMLQLVDDMWQASRFFFSGTFFKMFGKTKTIYP